MRPGSPSWVYALLGASLFLACARAGSLGGRERIEVQFGGCAGSRPGPVCLLHDGGRLTLWVDALPGSFLLELDGEPPAQLASETIQTGVRLQLQVPPGDHQLVVRPQKALGLAPWALEITASGLQAWEAPVRAQIQFGEIAAAVLTLTAKQSAMPAGKRGLPEGLLGKLAIMRGAGEEGEALLESALSKVRATAETQLEAEFAATLAHSYLTARGRLTDARRVLDRSSSGPGRSLEVRYLNAYYRGVLASMSGNARPALKELEEAVRLSERLGDARRHRFAIQMLAVQLQRHGRRGEAKKRLKGLLEATAVDAESCERFVLENNLAWNSLLSLEAGESVPNPAQSFVNLLERMGSHCSALSNERLNMLLSLALARLHGGDLEGAANALEHAVEANPDPGPYLLLWKRELDARLSFEAGQPLDALRRYKEIENLARLAWFPEASWRAVVGRARSLRAAGWTEEALAAFQLAERQLDQSLLRIPFHQGREAFVAQRATATLQHLDLLLELGRIDEAFMLARASRARLARRMSQSVRQQLWDPEAREHWYRLVAEYRTERERFELASTKDWQWPVEALEAIENRRNRRRGELTQQLDRLVTDLGDQASSILPEITLADGELALLFHPLPDGWAVFAKSSDTVRVSRARASRGECLPGRSLERQAECLLASLIGPLSEAKRLRMLTSGPFAAIDVQDLVVASTSLASLPVLYDLDLGESAGGGRLEAFPKQRQQIVVLSDPVGNLPAARKEGASIARLLADGAEVELLGRAEASGSELSAALSAADGFHFAGHAIFEGRDGWESYIPLAQGGRFTIEDILALERVPRWVFLSGCNTGRSATHGEGLESAGLAQAFLAAGSEMVVAAVRPVDDTDAQRFSRVFYRFWLDGSDPAEALHRAREELTRMNPEGDWSSYRVIRG